MTAARRENPVPEHAAGATRRRLEGLGYMSFVPINEPNIRDRLVPSCLSSAAPGWMTVRRGGMRWIT